MKPLLTLLGAALLSAGACACGGSNASTASHVSTSAGATGSAETATTDFRKIDGDRDNDVGAASDDTSNRGALVFGHAAGASERRTITALVKRYYATALAGDGARACSMIYSTLAEAAAEDYGLPGGPAYLRGAQTCRAVTSELFRHFHAQLAVEVPKLQVTHVLLNERQGRVLLGFASLPEREIPVTREGHVWRMAALLDSELP